MIISELSSRYKGLVFMLWGGEARKLKDKIDDKKHLILEAGHPSPVNTYGTFIGCDHFTLCNEYLTSNGNKPIDWNSICRQPLHLVIDRLTIS